MMPPGIMYIMICLLFIQPAWSQNGEASGQETKHLFLNGIYIENLNITIPWQVSFYDISKYGNPKIIAKTKKITHVRWDSIKVLNGTAIDLLYVNIKCALCKKEDEILKTLYGSIKFADIDKLKSYFENYTKVAGKLITEKNKGYYYYWEIDSCNVKLGNKSQHGSYLWVQKIL